ncbi:D-alanyl-D-alanine dipeptidase [Lysinibacillus telephonicus]|uniref:D-alanyl-D-alanine dipeptidase n=2 Tax=Lysinibacillus telephonicus TaxID=1714840 RepID=A0A431UV43_9BACI|nr:D-alanyl-D-alanine dipeptidase [Lysinibacillus telephonicus]
MGGVCMDSECQKGSGVMTENEEPLISLTTVSTKKIKVFPYYFKHQIPGSINDCFLREGVVSKLLLVADNLPEDHYLVILDGWRSFETQTALYEMIKRQFETQFDNEAEVLQHLSQFVATPSKDPLTPPPHYTGGAVDLTIGTSNGWLNMGTSFDEFTEKAHSLYFEEKEQLTEEELQIRENRRLLRSLMESVGFRSNPEEWWHFDYGNARWAEGTSRTVIYFGIELNFKGEN